MHYVLKDLSIDTEARVVCRGDISIKLPDLSFDVLIQLIEAAPEPVNIVGFSKSAWHGGYVTDETVAQRITLLRKALGDNSKDPCYVRTIRGSGYGVVGLATLVGNEPISKSHPILNRHNAIAAAGLASILLVGAWVSIADDPVLPPTTVTVDQSPESANSILLARAQDQLRLHQARETDRAIAMLREALTQEPESFDVRITLSFALSTKATKFGGGPKEKKEAEALARALISERSDNSNAWTALAYSLSSQGRVEESLPTYQTAYQLDPKNASAISSAAHLHLTLGNLHQALVLENRAIQAGGKSRYAEIQIAQNLELIGHSAATDWRDKALSLNPGQVVILSEVAKSYLRRGNPDAALEILAQAEGDDQWAPQILQLRSRVALASGDIEEARQLLEAIGDYGQFDVAVLDAAYGDVAQGQELLRAKLSKLEADSSSDTRIQLAELSAALGLEDEAISLIEQAVNFGWRDITWLKQSPYLSVLMSSKAGSQIENRIAREVDVQRRLIEGAEELIALIDS